MFAFKLLNRSIILGGVLFVGSFAITTDELISNMEKAEKAPHSIGTSKQVVTSPKGDVRTSKMKSYSADSGKVGLTVYLSPARSKGVKILSLNDGDDIWQYSPRTRRVRHLATHMKKSKVMGSDFSYEDMAGGDYRKKFTFRLLGEETVDGAVCYKLEMTPTKKGPDYKKLIAWVDKETYISRKVDYYNSIGLLKTLTAHNIKKVEGRVTPMKIVMTNKQEGGNTEITNESISYSEKPPKWMFTQEGLKRK